MTGDNEKYPVDNLKAAEHKVKAVFYALFRVFLKKGNPEHMPLDGGRVKRLLFLRPETKIGDMVISLPVFDGFKKIFPHVEISILCSPRNVSLIKDDPRFEKIFLYRKNIRKDIRELFRIRREKYDAVLDLLCDDSVTSLFISQWCAPGKPRLGVGKRKFARFYDFNRYNSVDNSRHIINNTLHLLDAFGVDSSVVSGYAPVFISSESHKKAGDFYRTLQFDIPGIKLVGFNLSAGSVSRKWSREKQIELIKKIHVYDDKIRMVVITVPKEREQGERLCGKFPGMLYHIPDRMNIIDVAAVIKKLDMLITPDTSLVHIARSIGVPVVSMYPGVRKNLVLWRPYGQQVGFAVASHHANIFDITVEQVFRSFVEIVESDIKVHSS